MNPLDGEVVINGKMCSFLLDLDRSKQHVTQQKLTDSYLSAVSEISILVHSHFSNRKIIGSEEQSGGEGEVELLILKNGLICGLKKKKKVTQCQKR